jgi:hypothetical protein
MTLLLNTAVFGLVAMPGEPPAKETRPAVRMAWARKTAASSKAKGCCVLKRLATKEELAAIRGLLKQIEGETSCRLKFW